MFTEIMSSSAGELALSRFGTTNTWNAQQIFKSPSATVSGGVFQSSGTVSAIPAGYNSSTIVAQFLAEESSAFPYTFFESTGNAQGHILAFRQSRGTYSARTATQSSDLLGQLDFGGFTGAGTSVNGKASIQVSARETWTPTANGTQIVFNVTPTGATAQAAALTLQTGTATFAGSVIATSTGATTPAGSFRSQGTISAIPTGSNNIAAQFITAQASTGFIQMESSGAVNYLQFRRRNGTYAVPTAIASGDRIGTVSWVGQWGTTVGNLSVEDANFFVSAAEAFTSTARGTQFGFETATIGTTTLVNRLTLSSASASFTVPVITTSNFQVSAAAGTTRDIFWRTSGSTRFTASINAVAETGSNAGSNFDIRRYSDAGADLGSALAIDRASGVTTLNANKFNLTTAITGITVSGSAGNTGDIAWDDTYLYVRISTGWRRIALGAAF